MKPGMRRFLPGVRPLLWWLVLMLTTPIIFRAWPAFLGIETSMSQILWTPLGLCYAAICAAMASLFLIVGRGRRGVLGAVAAALTFIEIIQGGIGWERIALFVLTLGCLGLVIEAIRQNYPILVELRRRDVKTSGGVLKAIVLWSPMLLVAYFGILANRALVTGAESLVYATTPVDQYCKGETEVPFPCEELERSDFSDRHEYTFGEDMSQYVRNSFEARQRLLIANIADPASLEDATFTGSKELHSALAKLSQDIAPTSILALPDVILTKEEWVARDAEVQRLTAQLSEARRRAPQKMRAIGVTGTVFLEPTFFSSLVEPVITNRIQSLERALNARKKAVMQSVPDAPDSQSDALGQSLSRALSSSSAVYAATSRAGLTVSWEDLLVHTSELISGRRALLTARSVTTLSKIQEQINATIETTIDDFVADPPGQQQLKQMKELAIPHNCSFERSSQDVYVDENLTEPIKINQASFPCETIPPVHVTPQKQSLPLDDNVKRSISAWKRGWERRIEEATREGLERAIDDPARAGAQANALADLVPREISLGRKHCKWSSLTSYGNCIANYGKRKAEGAYRNARVRTENVYTAGVTGTTLLAQITAAEQILKARQHAQDELLVAEQDLNDAVDTSAEMMRAAGLVLTIFLVIVLIKSFLYVSALVFFGRKGPSAIQLDGTSQIECTTPPRIGHGTQEFPIPLDPRFPLITKAILNNQNIEGIYLPWGFTALLSRLIHRKITFNKGGAVDPDKSVFFGHDTKHFVVWTLEEGEELVFQWKNFFGATENIELRSRVSLRLSTLLLGRMVFHTAKATGGRAYLLLTTQAIGAGSAADDSVDAAPPDRFVIWHPHTRFQVQNNLSMFSILNDSYALVRIKVEGKPSGRVLVESPKKYVFPLAGTFRYVIRLGSPF